MKPTTDTDRDEMLSATEAAKFLGMASVTLHSWRYAGIGPKYFKLGGAIRYRKSALEAYLAECEVATVPRRAASR